MGIAWLAPRIPAVVVVIQLTKVPYNSKPTQTADARVDNRTRSAISPTMIRTMPFRMPSTCPDRTPRGLSATLGIIASNNPVSRPNKKSNVPHQVSRFMAAKGTVNRNATSSAGPPPKGFLGIAIRLRIVRLVQTKNRSGPEERIIKGRPFELGFDRPHQRLQRGAPCWAGRHQA